jgi:RNA polymerase sigma factor (sigma-70 family)
MAAFKNPDMAQLGHQLALSPRRQRLAQIAGAERLLELVEPQREYPYDFVCFHLTGYRPLRVSKRAPLKGQVLISDLVRLIEHLSQTAAIPATALRESFQTQEQLSRRLSVSTKTIARWRQRGLSGLRVVDAEHVSRLVFTEQALLRFVSRNRELVLRGGAFRQLTADEREHIVVRAAELVRERRQKLQEVARTIAAETGRAVETIRYTLRRHDRETPERSLFGSDGLPSVPANYHDVYRARRRGETIEALARCFGISERMVRRICREMQAYELRDRKVTFVYNPQFDAPGAEEALLGAPEPAAAPRSADAPRAPNGAPAYLRALYDTPLLTQEQEQDLFRRYNLCKYLASRLIEQLEPCKATASRLLQIESLLERSDRYQQRLIQANLRLVVNIANRHLRPSINFFELISDGNMSLMRAVERFDFARGFRFSTYASWAILKNFARTVPESRSHAQKYVTGRDEILESAPDAQACAVHAPTEAESVREALHAGLAQLTDREREILAQHYGLGSAEAPTTLEQLGARFGVTKERIRQIEKRALAKLRAVLPPALADFATG